jgi:uncharacterized protein (DUF58 family)
MHKQTAVNPLATVSEPELVRLSRIADRLLAGRPSFTAGRRRDRNRAGGGTEFLDFRPYSSGDDLRHIDWRITARSGRPYIRRYHDELSADWYICLDRSTSMRFPDSGKWTLAVQLAAAVAYLLLHLGNRVGLIRFSSGIDGVCSLGRGYGQYINIASQLRNSEPRKDNCDSVLSSCARVLRQHWHVLVISDFLKPDAMHTDLRYLRSTGREVQAMQILSAHETTLGDNGMQTLRDAESGGQSALSLPAAGDLAHSRLQQLVTGLEEFSRRYRIHFTSCDTRLQWQEALVRHLRGIRHG